MAEKVSHDWLKLIADAEKQSASVARSIAGVDRFNPLYFLTMSRTAFVLSLISFGLALSIEWSSWRSMVAFLLLSFGGMLSAGSAFVAFREAAIYRRRWDRAKRELERTIDQAERLAAVGFVSTDKLDPVADDAAKRSLIILRDTIRDARERLGLKD